VFLYAKLEIISISTKLISRFFQDFLIFFQTPFRNMQNRRIDNLTKYMKFKGLNDNQVTVECNLSNGLLNKARAGVSDLSSKTVEKILKRFQDLSRVYLLTGEGEMIERSDTQINISGVNNGIAANVNSGNVYNNAPTPSPITTEDEVEEVDAVPVVPRSIYTEPNVNILEYVTENDVPMSPRIHQLSQYDLCYMVVNDEMAPYICAGDRIYLWAYPEGKERKIIDGRVYSVDTKLNGVLTRQLYKTEKGFIAKSFNARYADELLEWDDIYRVYRIVGVLRMDE
jgi:hypothetical protein